MDASVSKKEKKKRRALWRTYFIENSQTLNHLSTARASANEALYYETLSFTSWLQTWFPGLQISETKANSDWSGQLLLRHGDVLMQKHFYTFWSRQRCDTHSCWLVSTVLLATTAANKEPPGPSQQQRLYILLLLWDKWDMCHLYWGITATHTHTHGTVFATWGDQRSRWWR